MVGVVSVTIGVTGGLGVPLDNSEDVDVNWAPPGQIYIVHV